MPYSDVPRERAADGNPQGRVTASESDLWLDELMHDASLPSAPERPKNDLRIVLDWLGVKTVRDVGTAQRQQWARGFERYHTVYGTSDVLSPPLTNEIRGVFDRMLATDIDRMFATDEEIAKMRATEADPHAVPVLSQSSINEYRNGTTHSSTPDSGSTVLVVKGATGFASGFFLMLGLEVLLFSGMEFLSGHRLRPMGAGWIVMPIAVGCGGWILFREIDFSKIIGADRILAEFGKWPREHRIALAIVAAIGWIGGVLIGYFVSIASGADYYPRTLGTWLFGRWDWSSYSGLAVRYFPWASLAWGIVGGALGAAIVYAKQLLRF